MHFEYLYLYVCMYVFYLYVPVCVFIYAQLPTLRRLWIRLILKSAGYSDFHIHVHVSGASYDRNVMGSRTFYDAGHLRPVYEAKGHAWVGAGGVGRPSRKGGKFEGK